jgi:hypothetical protein
VKFLRLLKKNSLFPDKADLIKRAGVHSDPDAEIVEFLVVGFLPVLDIRCGVL